MSVLLVTMSIDCLGGTSVLLFGLDVFPKKWHMPWWSCLNLVSTTTEDALLSLVPSSPPLHYFIHLLSL